MSSEHRREGPHDVLDILVVGSGIAGLRAAVELAAQGARVAVLTKDSPADSNTGHAQGGIAVALSEDDSTERHLRDTLEAGDRLCDEEAVRVLVEEGPSRIQELMEWGARFDRERSRLAFGQEAAHSRRRIIHAHGDATGREIVRALLARASALPALKLLSTVFTVDLILERGRCAGVLVRDGRTGKLRLMGSGAVLLATGGAGRLYRETTNPPQATGDGVAMAYRAGAAVADMEFVQFHPTALYVPGFPRFLLSEALRGEGAVLRNGAGERFMFRYHRDGELAPRDSVSLAMDQEMERTGDRRLFLDLTGRSSAALRERFPLIYATCLQAGFDLSRDRIPVHPSAHYLMGGVKTDLHGRTSVPGLYAAGEVACTGVHGANRLASNSLLEGLVFGARAASAILESPGQGVVPAGPIPSILTPDPSQAEDLVREIEALMWDRAGIRRDGKGLRAARERLGQLAGTLGRHEIQRAAIEARNLLVLAGLVTGASLEREESRGAHYRCDFPRRRQEWTRHLEYRAPFPAPDLPGHGGAAGVSSGSR